MSLWFTEPANAPLPTTCSFPFHPVTGSHTSILIVDCGVGFNVAATRQNDGRLANNAVAGARPGRAGGAGKAPALTVSVIVTLVVALVSDVRLSHVAASAAAADRMMAAVTGTIRCMSSTPRILEQFRPSG